MSAGREATRDAPEVGPPPWIDETIQQRIEWRDGDVVVSVPAKSGTTWTMNIVHQLRSGGDGSFTDIYLEVPWVELVPGPDKSLDDLVAKLDEMPRDLRRSFKTHAAPPTLPYQNPGEGPDVRYLVVARNPDEAIASFRPFLAAHSDAWYDLWQVDKRGAVGPDFDTYISGFVSHALAPRIFGFLAAWWPLRHESNVMLVHYADLKRRPETTIRRDRGVPWLRCPRRSVADHFGVHLVPVDEGARGQVRAAPRRRHTDARPRWDDP